MFSCWTSTDCEKEGEGSKRDTIAEQITSKRTTEIQSVKFSDILEDAIGQYHVRIFAEQNRTGALAMLNCMKDINLFKHSPSNNVRETLAKKICEGYSDSELSGGNSRVAEPKEGEVASVGTIGYQMQNVRAQLKENTTAPAGNSLPKECSPGMFRVVENMLTKNIEQELGSSFLNSNLFTRYKEAKKIKEEATVTPKTKDFKTLIPNLSSGGFCTVYACVKKKSGRVMALKVITVKTPGVAQTKRPKNAGKPEKLKAVLAERNCLVGIKSRFVVDLKYAMQLSRTKVALVFDLAEAGDLRMLMKSLPPSGKGLPEKLVKFWAAEILLGLECLHKNQIIMRDLKSRNVLLDASGHARLCDLGLAAPCKNSMQSTSRVGTTGWMSPEVILMKPYDKRSDYFSYGILIYRMIANKHPFSGKHWQECESKYGNTLNKCGCLEVEDYPKEVFSEKLRRFLYSGCMGKYAYERYDSCEKFKSHVWLEDIDFAKLEAGLLEPPKNNLAGLRKKLNEIREKVDQYTNNPNNYSDLDIGSQDGVVQREGYEVEGITEHERNLRKLTYVNEDAVEQEILDVLEKIDRPKTSIYNASNKRSEYYKRLKEAMLEYPPYSGPRHSTRLSHKRVSLSDSLPTSRRDEGQVTKPSLTKNSSGSRDFTSHYIGSGTTSVYGKRATSSHDDKYNKSYTSKPAHSKYGNRKQNSLSLSLRNITLPAE